MVWKTRRDAKFSLHEFTPRLRAAHDIVKFWSTKDNAWRWTRVLNTTKLRTLKN